jgi:hypothetical protein
MLLDVQKPGARWDPVRETITAIPGELATVAVCRLDKKPRYTLFSTAVKRLMDAGLVNIRYEKFWTNCGQCIHLCHSLRENDNRKADLRYPLEKQ